MGLSCRGMSARLQLSNNLWAQYEAGKKEPGLSTLSKLRELGFSIDWLISGEGEPLLPSLPGLPGRIHQRGFSLQEIRESIQSLLSIQYGREIALWYEVINALNAHDRGLSLDELTQHMMVSVAPEELLAELQTMQQEGVISCHNGLYRKVKLYRSNDLQDIDLKLLWLMKGLLEDFLPQFKADPQRGKLISGKVSVARGQGVAQIRAFVALANKWRETASIESPAPNHDVIDVYIALLSTGADAHGAHQRL